MSRPLTKKVSPMLEKLESKHPLQRLQSPSVGFSALVHVLGLSSFAASFKFLLDHPNPASEAFGWHFSYLTIIGLGLSTLTFVLGALADVSRSPKLFLAKNLVSIVATPLEVVISTLYWGLAAIDPKLVKPEFSYLPPLADISFHVVPSLVLVLDLLLLSPPWTIAFLPTLALGGLLSIAYWFWIEVCYSKNGWYPYPLFELATREQRLALFGLAAVIFTGSAVSLRWAYAMANGFEASRARPRNVKA